MSMERAIQLARMALGSTSPNPAVGAVIVRDGVTVGEGYTQAPGSDHAEIVALKQAGESARGATLYVTLEPCCHHGRTPPCVDAVIAAGLAEVRIALLDPNPVVHGNSADALMSAGIRVEIGEGESEATCIVEAFTKHIATSLPFVTAKWAMTLDGKIATTSGDSKWISGEESRAYAHYLRAINDAVLVGAGTAKLDDPLLTVRIPDSVAPQNTPARVWPAIRRNPLRIVLDGSGTVPLDSRVFDTSVARTLVASTERMPKTNRRQLEDKGVEVILVEDNGGQVDLRAVLRLLGERGLNSVLIEGGARVMGDALGKGVVDKICAFVAPVIVGGSAAPGPVSSQLTESMNGAIRLRRVDRHQLGPDVLIIGYL